MAEFHNGEWIFLYILFLVEGNAIQPIRKHALNITLDNQKVKNEILCLYAHGNPNRLGWS